MAQCARGGVKDLHGIGLHRLPPFQPTESTPCSESSLEQRASPTVGSDQNAGARGNNPSESTEGAF